MRIISAHCKGCNKQCVALLNILEKLKIYGHPGPHPAGRRGVRQAGGGMPRGCPARSSRRDPSAPRQRRKAMTSKPYRAGSDTLPWRSRWTFMRMPWTGATRRREKPWKASSRVQHKCNKFPERGPKVPLRGSERTRAYERERSGFSRGYASDGKYRRETGSTGLGLENRRGRESTVGSNPTPSAITAGRRLSSPAIPQNSRQSN